jgi:nickel/cobalt exporter
VSLPPASSRAIDLIGASALGDRLVGLVQSPGFVPLAFGIAFLAGAAHAVGPGHGKSLAAAYLVGSDGKVRDAAWLGFSVAAMHTVSVLVIAVAWTFLSLSDIVRLERLTTALQLIGGLLVVGIGVWLFRRHVRRRGTHQHGHGHGHHQDATGPSRPGLVLLGISGGLTPSPSAFLVLITGIFSGRSGFALLLVIVFGLGLAGVLFGVGLFAVAGRNVMVRAAESRAALAAATRLAPVLAAGSITLIGCGLTTLAVSNLVGAA